MNKLECPAMEVKLFDLYVTKSFFSAVHLWTSKNWLCHTVVGRIGSKKLSKDMFFFFLCRFVGWDKYCLVESY
jgi:hypothetical protein